MTGEKWLPVPDWEGLYEVSDRGHVRSVRRPGVRGKMRGGRVLRTTIVSRFPVVRLCRGGVPRSRYVHQLVVTAFIGPRPEGMVARHLDGDPTNNRLGNLRWAKRGRTNGE